MRGIVEVYTFIDGKETLVERDDNLLVDGFGKLIADVMTLSPSLSAVESASSILDASSYRINAISFGKDACGYYGNSHFINTNAGVNVLTAKVTKFVPAGATSPDDLTYFPDIRGLPEAPTPEDTRLERRNTQTPTEKAFESTVFANTQQWNAGQNCNAMGVSSLFSNKLLPLLVGTYAPSTGVWVQSITPDETNSSGGTTLKNLLINPGNLNSDNNIDVSGFINLQNTDGVANVGNYSPSNGLIVSGTAEGDFSSTGEVLYVLYLNGPDLACNALFGGIWTAGLWCLDVPAMLVSGTTPPFLFQNMTIPNNRIYRLVCKKVFSNDLCYNKANGGVGGISRLNNTGHSVKIVWRLLL